jgi:hypothetical protein
MPNQDRFSNPDGNPLHYLPAHEGEEYTTVLTRLHMILKPKTYLEIGTLNGGTLALASCRCISIDPAFNIDREIIGKKEELHIYQLPSDEFFARHDPVAILGQKIDFAFLDGMHLFEFLLRDFINTEKGCKPNSVVALHDCIPIDPYMTRRKMADPEFQKLSQRPGWWTGDVWKTISVLKKYRPDLKIIALDCPPSGLVLITQLNPSSTRLSDNYFNIVDEFSNLDLREGRLRQYHEELNIRNSRDFESLEAIASIIWL